MRLTILTIYALFAAILIVFLVGKVIENGDTNAASMYLVVFLGPIFLLVVLNSLLLSVLRNFKSRIVHVMGAILPIAVLVYFSFLKDITIPSIDGNLVFVARVGVFLLGLVNLIWYVDQIKKGNLVDKS